MIDYNTYNDDQLLTLMRYPKPASDRAFVVLYNRYSKKLYSYCLFLTSDQNDAHEICQETWTKFFKKNITGLDLKADNILVYLTKTIKNNYLNFVKKSSQTKHVVSLENLDLSALMDSSNFLKSIESNEILKYITIAAEHLDDKSRDTFLLLWFSGLSYQEVANIQGDTIKCVRTRSYRAMDKIISLLQPIIKDLSK